MITIEEYKQMFFVHNVQELKKKFNYPETELELSFDEIKLVIEMRSEGLSDEDKERETLQFESDVFELTYTEAEKVLKHRVNNLESYKSLCADIARVEGGLKTKEDCWVFPYYRNLIVVRTPSQGEWELHKCELDELELKMNRNKLSEKDYVASTYNLKFDFVKRMLVFPTYMSLPTANLNIKDELYKYILAIATDREGMDYLKVKK
jgi:hypothetical protein